MPVATSTIAALAVVGALGGKMYSDSKKAANAAPPAFEPPPIPQYTKPKMADAIRLQRARATGASGRTATIKTGPAGIPAPPPVAPKTLLGQ